MSARKLANDERRESRSRSDRFAKEGSRSNEDSLGAREEDLGREVVGLAGMTTGSTERSMINFVVKRPYKR